MSDRRAPAAGSPAAWPPAAVPPARRRALELLHGADPNGMTVAHAAAQLGGHPNSARAHLDGLAAAGLAVRGTTREAQARPARRGRPAISYRITAAGRAALGGQPTQNQSLAAAFAACAARLADPEAVRQVGRIWAQSVTGQSADVSDEGAILARLGDLMGQAGFAPARDADELSLSFRACPFLGQAIAGDGATCDVHQGLIDGAVDSWQLGIRAQLHPFSVPGACGLTLVPSRRKAGAARA